MQYHRGRSQFSQKRLPPSHLASKQNKIWTWDIIWLKVPIKELFYRLYLIVDLFGRKMVGHMLVLHSDNGSPMKAATFQVLLEKLGIQSSYSRPRVSNDNLYSEAAFRMLKYRAVYPYNGF